MILKKHLTLIVSCSIAAVIVLVETLLLFRFSGEYSEIRRDLKSAESEVEALMRRDPFPSDNNIAVERENLEKLKSQLENIHEWMHGNQIQYEEWTTPTEFQIKLDPNLQELRSLADERGIVLPANFHFSFKKYAEGEMPAGANVPRLSRQLQMIEALCEILFANKIDMLQSISRTEFDSGGGSASEVAAPSFSGRRSSGSRETGSPSAAGKDSREEKVDKQGMYAWEEFEFGFRTREQSLWGILRGLANTNLLVSVEDVKFSTATDAIENFKAPETTGSARGGRGASPAFDPEGMGATPRDMRGARVPSDNRPETEAAAIEELPREERVIAGDQPINVVMKMRMYRFLDENDQEKEERIQ